MTVIVGLSGFAGVGKDTAANVMVRELGFKKISFGDPIKEAVTRLNPTVPTFGDPTGSLVGLLCRFGWDNREIGSESYFAAWDTAKQFSEVRRLLQVFGADVARQMFGDSVWLDIFYREAQKYPLVVNPSIRFHNEAVFLRNNNGFTVTITRPGIGPVNSHVSEEGLPATLTDYTLHNEGSIPEFEELVLDCFRRLAIPGTSTA